MLKIIEDLSNEEVCSFYEGLLFLKDGRMHCRKGPTLDVEYYCVVYVSEDKQNLLKGHLSGRFNLSYRFTLSLNDSHSNALISIEPVTKRNGHPLCLSKEQVLETIKISIRKMSKNIKTKNDGFGCVGWKGYYLWRVPGKKVSPVGKRRFKEAIQLDFITPEFMQDCIDCGISMKYCSGKKKAA